MNRRLRQRLKIGLDWDDVTAPFNSLACQMANEKYSANVSINDITSWKNDGKGSVIKEFYFTEELYKRQKPTAETILCIRDLMEIADVYFITACYPQFMGIRAQQILDAFPGFPEGNILLGGAKNLVQFDIILDDAPHNVLDSPAQYPVLMRKPWNKELSGMLSVNSMKEFVSLVRQILSPSAEEITTPSVIAIVGPTGSGKNRICEKLASMDKFERPLNYTTKVTSQNGHICVSEEEFNSMDFLETTTYGGNRYGTTIDDVSRVLAKGNNAVLPLDMCGAIAMKKAFRTVIIYIAVGKERIVEDIIKNNDYSDREKTLRILSIDAEKRNAGICDFEIDNENDDATDAIRALVKF